MTRSFERSTKQFFLAASGMITPIGANTPMTLASVNAAISAYSLADYYNQHFQQIKVTELPASIFAEQGIDATDWSSAHDARLALMANIALQEACAIHALEKPIPLILAMTDMPQNAKAPTGAILTQQLAEVFPAWINPAMSRSLYSGRAAGMDALAFAFNYLYDMPTDFILIGGCDSFLNAARLQQMDSENRLLSTDSGEGFAPGEAAGFLLLTRRPELALTVKGHAVVLHSPGIADEPGHRYSEEPYRGDGLDQAFKSALAASGCSGIHSIYSSMNGESFWAKEYGVAYMRSKAAFADPVKLIHPADCYGDIGAATAPVLIGLAAQHLLTTPAAQAHLVYSSSDTARRGAVVLEKVAMGS